MEQMITIVVPVYNAEEKLDRCVQSLLNQSYTNVEILLVNDGSRDNSLSICRKYAQQDSRVVVIDKPNGGVSSARNAGLDAARGEYIMFCDSDDWVEPDWCECMVTNYRDGDLTVCDIVWGGVCSAEEKGQTVIDVVDRNCFMHRPLLMCAIFNKIFLRSILETHGLRFSRELSLGEDFCFVLSYLSKITGSVRYINKKKYCYDDSTEGSLSKKAPSLEQCDLFYWYVTREMMTIGIEDGQSFMVRDDFATRHFEMFLYKMACSRDISLHEKLKIAGHIKKMESFSQCCGGVKWGNPIYLWLYRKRCVRLVVIYLILRSYRDQRRAAR